MFRIRKEVKDFSSKISVLSRPTLPKRSYRHTSLQSYHSYPDPDDKPVITSAKSTVKPKLDKSSMKLDSKFRLDKIYPGFSASDKSNNLPAPKTEMTKLANGLTVASQDVPGLMTSFAFMVRAGSSYEDKSTFGATHFLELNAFKSTKSRDQLELITEIERMGGLIQAVSTRENIIYCVDVLRENTEAAFQIFADSILNPVYPEEELNEARMIVQLQQEELPGEIFSRDLVQRAAFQNSPLGNHHFVPVDRVNEVTAESLYQYRKKFFFGENLVVSGAGIEHPYLVELTNKYLTPSIPKGNDLATFKRPTSKYTGGMIIDQRTLKDEFVRVGMSFDVGGWDTNHVIPACVLQQLLGGGSSFSAGGPGKGMYSRLYTQVLNKHYWAESVEAVLNLHEKSGTLGIDGSCPPQNIVHMIKVIAEQFSILAVIPISQIELSRAKNMLKSMMMMQLESRLVICEDIGRQVLTFGFREDPTELCKKIDAVTAEDIMNVAAKMLLSSPSVGIVGAELDHVPEYENIRKFTQDLYQEIWRNRQGKR